MFRNFASWLGWFLLCGAAQGAPGDISVAVVDMYNRPISGANGGQAVLLGVDDRGFRAVGNKLADSNGMITFTAQEINAAIQGQFGFVLYTYGGSAELRSQLYDPFGQWWTYIRYHSTIVYQFTVPTPISGQAAPETVWDGTNSILRFGLDLGNRSDTDFWFTRVVLQKKAADTNYAGSDFGLNPVITPHWLSTMGYAMEDGGLTNGQSGNIRIIGPGYNQTFFAKKLPADGGATTQYIIFLVNCLWEKDLVGVYDQSNHVYELSLNPAHVFTDTNAPAWDGPAMKDQVEYFAAVQAQLWLWHSAGANNGLAIDMGSGVVNSLFYPIRINDQQIRLTTLGRTNMTVAIQVFANQNLPYRLEYSTNLANPAGWISCLSATATASPFILLDTNASSSWRFYRLRQP
jgi:hypothetical protein